MDKINYEEKLSIFDFKENNKLKNMRIQELKAPAKVIRCLFENGVTTIGELVTYGTESIKNFDNIFKVGCDYLIDEIHDLGIVFADELGEDNLKMTTDNLLLKEKLLNSGFECLNLPQRLKTVLKHKKINRIKDISDYDSSDVENFRNIGKSSFEILSNTLHEYGVFFKDEKAPEENLVKKLRLLEDKKALLLDKVSEVDKDIAEIEIKLYNKSMRVK